VLDPAAGGQTFRVDRLPPVRVVPARAADPHPPHTRAPDVAIRSPLASKPPGVLNIVPVPLEGPPAGVRRRPGVDARTNRPGRSQPGRCLPLSQLEAKVREGMRRACGRGPGSGGATVRGFRLRLLGNLLAFNRTSLGLPYGRVDPLRCQLTLPLGAFGSETWTPSWCRRCPRRERDRAYPAACRPAGGSDREGSCRRLSGCG
jgi:hypothetical protein